MAPKEHAAQIAVLVNQLIFLEHAINPTRHGDAVFAHHGGRCIPTFDPFKIDIPSFGKVLPRTFGKAIVARQ